MANLQVKNVPAALHRQIRWHARQRGQTIRELLLEAVRREVGRAELRQRLARRRPVDLGRPAAAALAEARLEQEQELGA